MLPSTLELKSRLHGQQPSLTLGLFKQLQRLEQPSSSSDALVAQQSTQGQRWLMPYADMLTGLFVIVLVMYAHTYQQWQWSRTELTRTQVAYQQVLQQLEASQRSTPASPPSPIVEISSLKPTASKSTSHS